MGNCGHYRPKRILGNTCPKRKLEKKRVSHILTVIGNGIKKYRKLE